MNPPPLAAIPSVVHTVRTVLYCTVLYCTAVLLYCTVPLQMHVLFCDILNSYKITAL